MFFFFFFDELYDRPTIQKAFKNICLDKMLADGYFDMRKYVEAKVERLKMYSKLQIAGSKFANLFKEKYPRRDEALKFWREMVADDEDGDNESAELTQLDSDAIVYWVYQVCGEKKDRENITEEIFARIKQLNGIDNCIKFKEGIAYNSGKVSIEIISSVSDFYNIIKLNNISTERLFFRGHSNSN